MSPPSQTALPAMLCPPPRTASSRSCARAKRTARATSSASAHRTMSAGPPIDHRVPDRARLVVAGGVGGQKRPAEVGEVLTALSVEQGRRAAGSAKRDHHGRRPPEGQGSCVRGVPACAPGCRAGKHCSASGEPPGTTGANVGAGNGPALPKVRVAPAEGKGSLGRALPGLEEATHRSRQLIRLDRLLQELDDPLADQPSTDRVT